MKNPHAFSPPAAHKYAADRHPQELGALPGQSLKQIEARLKSPATRRCRNIRKSPVISIDFILMREQIAVCRVIFCVQHRGNFHA
jgi:hypothetical protein